MKMFLIGPVFPYKGGISHYTSLMYRALEKKHDVTMISYKMQYPKILYHKEQRDYSDNQFKVENTFFWLNTANPFNIWRIANKINSLKPDCVIVQWWHPYFAPCYYLLSQNIKAKIIFICHNVFPHERFPFDRQLTKLALKNGNGFVLHSHLDLKGLLSVKENVNYTVTPHPTYGDFKVRDLSLAQARELLEIDKEKHVLLFFGFVREYKGLKYLLEAMPKIKKADKEIILYVVGDFGKAKDQYMEQINSLGIQNIVRIIEGYVPDNDVEKYFASSDLVVCPYLSATQSGIVQIAFGFETPVIVTNVGGLPEVVEHEKTGYIIPPRNVSAISKCVTDFFENNRKEEMAENIKREAYRFSWEKMTAEIEKLLG